MENKKPPDKGYFKAIKIPLKHILKNPEINLQKINNAVIRSNDIVIYTLQFMKLYLLDYYQNNNDLPTINKNFIMNCMKTVSSCKKSSGLIKKENRELKDKLQKFYQEYYQPLIPENLKLDYSYLNNTIEYLATSILTIYENNIKLHFIKYLDCFLDSYFDKKSKIDKIRNLNISQEDKKLKIKEYCQKIKYFKYDILNLENPNDLKSKKIYHLLIKKYQKLLIPDKPKFLKNNIFYDIQVKPQDYLKCMIFMMQYVEKKEAKIYNIFPLRSEIIPKHIKIDTSTLIHLLITKKQGKKGELATKGNMKKLQDKIWKFFFRTERKCFKMKDYSFHHMIETDGVSCSILLIKTDKKGKRIIKNNIIDNSLEIYLNDLKHLEKLKDKKIVGIDPGKEDLIYCVDNFDKTSNKFRYSQNQVRKESKRKKFAKIQLKLKEEKINNQTIIEIETELSVYNRKTLNIDKFKEYIILKNKINEILSKFYQKEIFRKLKLNGYINLKRSEQNMINRFQKLFGEPKETIIAIGDWEQKKQMKYKESTKGKGIRDLFRKSGYQVYLVDEFRTSKKCSKCEIGDCIKFLKRENPKPFKNNIRLVHGLIRCKNCSNLWNRDCNGAINIYKIANNLIKGLGRPKYLCRTKK